MIGLASHHRDQEDGTLTPDVTALAWEVESEQPQGSPQGSPLEWYLIRLLEPTDDAPHEQVPQPADERHVDEPMVSQPPDTAEAPGESKPLWQTAEEEPSKVQADTGVARRAKPKPVIRSYARKERANGKRQKLMMALIPVLAIVLVAILRNFLGAPSAATAAVARPKETAPPVRTNVELTWEIPALYELSDRDPMRLTPPAAVAVEDAETTARPMEPPVDLRVTGILYSADKPTAIVDTQLVREGQQISGATVEKIDTDGVQFERNGRRWKQAINR